MAVVCLCAGMAAMDQHKLNMSVYPGGCSFGGWARENDPSLRAVQMHKLRLHTCSSGATGYSAPSSPSPSTALMLGATSSALAFLVFTTLPTCRQQHPRAWGWVPGQAAGNVCT